MKLNNANVTAAVVIALLLTLGGAIYQQGRLSNQLENLSEQIALMREENRLYYADLSRDIQEIHHDNAALLEELRRSIRQLLDALGNHTHDASGNPVFTIPPGYEPDTGNRPQ